MIFLLFIILIFLMFREKFIKSLGKSVIEVGNCDVTLDFSILWEDSGTLLLRSKKSLYKLELLNHQVSK